MSITSRVVKIRIVSPSARATDEATIDDVQPGDVIEVLDRPIYRVDPTTRQSTTDHQRFLVGTKGITPIQRRLLAR